MRECLADPMPAAICCFLLALAAVPVKAQTQDARPDTTQPVRASVATVLLPQATAGSLWLVSASRPAMDLSTPFPRDPPDARTGGLDLPAAGRAGPARTVLIGTAVGAGVGFGIATYDCARAGEGAICLPGYLLITGLGAAAGFVVSLIIASGQS